MHKEWACTGDLGEGAVKQAGRSVDKNDQIFTGPLLSNHCLLGCQLISELVLDRQINSQADIQIERQTGRQTDRQIGSEGGREGKLYRQTDR